MRGPDERSGSMFSKVDLEAQAPRDHPLRLIKEIANPALADLGEGCKRRVLIEARILIGVRLRHQRRRILKDKRRETAVSCALDERERRN